MAQFKLPPANNVVDKQFLQIAGPDGQKFGYKYNSQTRTFYAREADIIIPSFHGQTHIAEDPVPNATTDTPGLMSSSDKAKLDALTQTRLGVLGFSGAGFPDDGGYLQGDIVLAAGTEFISLERIGNVIRFTVDSPVPLNCGCEECAQIFWIQDESDTASIRPPSCAGKLPGVNSYGEMKVYLLPENTVLNPSNPTATLNKKTSYPALIFKRADDTVTPGQGEFELILSRNANSTTNVGWAMTPGASGKVETVWFTGLDDDGNQIRFELNPENDAELLGSVFYKGHTLTRQMAVVTDYPSNILSTNQYHCKFWAINRAEPRGSEFTATNVWQYNNPENSPTDLQSPRQLVKDATSDLLPIGTLVQIWEFQVGEINGERIVRRFFSRPPKINPGTLWNLGGAIRFGDLLETRDELTGVDPEEITASVSGLNDLRLIERDQWGIVHFDDPLILADDGEVTAGTDEGPAVRSDSVNNVDTDGDPDDPEPNFTITAESAKQGSGKFFTNELADRVLVFTSGNLQSVEFEIIDNSASRITLYDPDGQANEVEAGDTFDIFVGKDTNEPSGVALNNQYVAELDPNLPGLVVSETAPPSDQERPVWVWHKGNHKNVYVKALVGRPDSSRFPPIDIVLRGPIDSIEDEYLKVVRRGVFETGPFQGNHYIVVKGAKWKDLPESGTLRILTGLWRNFTWQYQHKAAFDRLDSDAVVLIGFLEQFPFDINVVPDLEGTGATDLTGPTGTNVTEEEQAREATVPENPTVVQLLHKDYTSPAVRLEFSINSNTDQEAIQFQTRAGILDMSEPYSLNLANDFSDDFVRGFRPGTEAVSKIHTQDGFIDDGVTELDSTPSGFKVYDGGSLPVPVDGEDEKWNELEIMYRDGQLWVWWNKLLVPPDPSASAELPTPVAISTPYFPVDPTLQVGKVGFRLWPGAKIREIEVRDQLVGFNEFVNGQLELNTDSEGTG